jgi:RNA polymerase sigma factor (sigma-70 family)
MIGTVPAGGSAANSGDLFASRPSGIAGPPFSSGGRSGMTALMDRPSGARTSSDESRRLAGTLAATLVAVGAGDAAAMADLYARTSAKLYGICLRIVGNSADAEEVLQETYVTVWRKAAAYDAARASAITWLAILARNKAIDRLRVRPAPSGDIAGAADIADERPSSLDLLEEAEDEGRLSSCLDELAAEQSSAAEAIRAAFLDGLAYPALALRQGVPLGTMKSWVRRGLLRLRGCLER